jgi:hypothetical protein
MADITSNMPGVFRGNSRMASQQDLAILRQEILQLIAGPINEVSEIGYIPWKYNNDGDLDISYYFPELETKLKECNGIIINKNGYPFATDIQTINFTGTYVRLSIDESGNLVCDISEPKNETSGFNSKDGITDAIVRIENEVIEEMIIPNASNFGNGQSIFGDWAPGSKHPGINKVNSSEHTILKLFTNEECIAFSTESYFEVLIKDQNDDNRAAFVSDNIVASTGEGNYLNPSSTGRQSKYVHISILNFTDVGNQEFKFKPVFYIDLNGIMEDEGGRFKIIIKHHDCNGKIIREYKSEEMFFNCGKIPTISRSHQHYQLISDTSSVQEVKNCFEWCSGLKYITNGSILFSLNKIYDLNNMAAIDDKISYEFEIANQKILKSGFINYTNDLDLEAQWEANLYLNKETFNNKSTSGYIIVRNAYGESEKEVFDISILLNSVTTNRISDDLNEYFTNELHRNLHNFKTRASENVLTLANWDSTQDLKTYDGGYGLMVIPGKGLCYPYGEWSSFIPLGSHDYNGTIGTKYFARTFTGNNNSKLGGIFEFEGITKDEFMSDGISVIISYNNGQSWLSLKDVRGVESSIVLEDLSVINVTGVLTNISEKDGKLQVSWMYPGTICSSNKLYFKLGMKQTVTSCIKAISLLNSDGTKDW